MPNIEDDDSLPDFLKSPDEFIEASKRGETEPVALLTWIQHDTWSEEEAILILLGLNPFSTQILFLESMDGNNLLPVIHRAAYLDSRELHGFSDGSKRELRALSDRYRAIWAIWLSGSHKERNPPMYYIEWASTKEISIPWLDWARQNNLLKQTVSKDEAKDEKPLLTRERNNIARIIAALSNEANLNLDEPYKSAGLVEKITIDLGCPVSDDTIAKWLKEAAEQIEQGKK
jgi:hypothetical protein